MKSPQCHDKIIEVTQPFAQLAEEQLNQAFQERLLNYARVLRAALDFVRESVSWLTGAAAPTVIPGLSNYSQASGALHAMIGQLALELAPVRINCAALGLTRTKVWDHLGMSKEAQAAMYANAEKSLLLIHVAAPKENAHALFFEPPVPTLQSLYST